jgi:asparagine synthase (glutamine-hydrolysing)
MAFSENGQALLDRVNESTAALSHRGPDGEGVYRNHHVALGHRRLSIIDLTDAGNQPMTDETGRFTIVFNGEFFNYAEHRKALIQRGVTFRSQSDTEVLLQLYKHEGAAFLNKINGFFAMAIYDALEGSLFIARDRLGIKPLVVYDSPDMLAFASEMQSLLKYGIPREPDMVSLFSYLQLNYIPPHASIFKHVRKLQAGTYLLADKEGIRQETYYEIPVKSGSDSPHENEKHLLELLDSSVKRRMISDVPLGAFLSGGIDSSVVVALASAHTSRLSTFSIGYRDEPLYDETSYAMLVAKKYRTDHHVFSLGEDDMLGALDGMLSFNDEPFADSSALPLYILSQQTSKHVKVALSGDGADEMFAGYNKHRAEYIARRSSWLKPIAHLMKPVAEMVPSSRNTYFGNKSRQFLRFEEALQLEPAERYWQWCSITNEIDAKRMMKATYDTLEYGHRKASLTRDIKNGKDLTDVLLADMKMVLAGDMLVKADRMSMAHGLEVRNPFLDVMVVDFAFGLPSSAKIDRRMRKKILQNAFRGLLPAELYNRPKKGFEVPLLKWMRTGLETRLDRLLEKEWIEHQGLFDYEEISLLRKKLASNSPGDAPARLWALMAFQEWWIKNMAA